MIRAVRTRLARASDADRDRAVAKLRDHAVAGRLTVEDLDERSGKAFSARTLDQLDAVLADLPRRRWREPAPARALPLLWRKGSFWCWSA